MKIKIHNVIDSDNDADNKVHNHDDNAFSNESAY